MADVNGDGKLDLLVGDSVILTRPAKGLSTAVFRMRHDSWQKAMQAVLVRLSNGGDEKVREEYTRLRQARSEFLEERWAGFVWLYLRK